MAEDSETDGYHYANITEFFDQMNPNDEFSHYAAMIYITIMPLCCIAGFIGNCLVFILIRTNHIFRRLPSSPYLLALAGCSNTFLISLFAFWLEINFLKGPYDEPSTFICKFWTFLSHFSDFASVWLIVLIGYERLILLYKATHFQRSLSNSRRQVCILLLISFVCNIWILFVSEINKEQGICDIHPGFEQIHNIFSTIELGLCMIVPSILIILSNVLVIVKLRTHLKHIPASIVSFNAKDTVYSEGPAQTIKTSKISKASRLNSRLSMTIVENAEVVAFRSKRNIRYADLELTKSLITMMMFFIFMNLPNYLYRTTVMLGLQEIMQVIVYCSLSMLYAHHAFLFFVYIFNSPQP